MTIKNIVIQKMYERFPEHTDLINELYEESETFRTLCEDYVDCQSVVERLRYNMNMVKRNTLDEYEQLSGELEAEIISRIDRELDVK